jgi:hypothetical protein
MESKSTDMDLEPGPGVDAINDEYVWRSCCNSALDRRAIIFFCHFFLAVAIVFFCCYQLVFLQSCEAQSLYSGIITLILGIYCPSPKITKK